MRFEIGIRVQQGCDVAARRRISVNSQLHLQNLKLLPYPADCGLLDQRRDRDFGTGGLAASLISQIGGRADRMAFRAFFARELTTLLRRINRRA